MARVTAFEIVNHGYEHAQYFQGCGVAFTRFQHCVTGAGDNAKEAFEDACEQIAMAHDSEAAQSLPDRPAGIRVRDHVPADCRGEDSEIYWYVSIRYSLEGGC